MKHCIDCKHFTEGYRADPDEPIHGRCSKDFTVRTTRIVGGESVVTVHKRPDAGTSRNAPQGCGLDAKWFEAK